jgi:hypothetical protein
VNEEVVVVSFILTLILFIILLDKLSMLKERCDDLEYRIQSIILDDFMERAFKSDNQRFDLALRDGVRKLVSEELEKRRIDNGL